MIGVLGALLASVAWGTSDFAGGRASRGRHVLAVLAITRPAGLVGIALLVAGLPNGALGDRWPSAVAAGVVLLGGMLCLYRALAVGPMPVVAPIFTTAATIPVLVGVAAGEEPSLLVGAGLVVAAGGAVLAARTPRAPAPPAVAPAEGDAPAAGGSVGPSGAPGRSATPGPPAGTGVRWAVATAVLIGIGLTLVDHASEADPLRAILVERATETVLVLLILALGWRRLSGDLLPVWPIPVIGLLDLAANVGFAFASRAGLLPVVAVLSSLYPVVTVLLAWSILGERTTRIQFAGAALTLVGVAVVAAGGAG